MQDLLWTHQNLSFQNTVSFVGHDDKTFFSTHGKMKTGFFSYFLNGWWNVHPWNRFHGWTLHWRFTKEESVAKQRNDRSLNVHYKGVFSIIFRTLYSTIYGIDFRTLFPRINCTQSCNNYSQKPWQFSTYSAGSWYGILEIS